MWSLKVLKVNFGFKQYTVKEIITKVLFNKVQYSTFINLTKQVEMNFRLQQKLSRAWSSKYLD